MATNDPIYDRPWAWWEIAALWIAAAAVSQGWIALTALLIWGVTRAGDWVCSRLEDPARVEARRRAMIRRRRRERLEAAKIFRKT
jgi:hypothetical protein